jgi:hypothetical protein
VAAAVPDVHADADLPGAHDLRIAGAALLLPATAVSSGRTAVHLWGVRGPADRAMPVEVTVPPEDRFGPVAGIRVRQARLAPSEIAVRGGYRWTSEVRTTLDLARLPPVLAPVPVLDVLLARCIVSASALDEAAAELPTGRGVRRARQAVALADERAESPQEWHAAVEAGRQPKSWVHHGPPAPWATPTPRVCRSQFRMLRRWPPLLPIQSAITAAASGCP